jgi:drug/metabolite transporter (DMT)-like permease
MDPFVFVAVLIAAACHAGWNAILKVNVEPIVATTMVAVASGLVVVPFAFLTGLPDAAAWPYLVASVVIHIGYYLALAEAYRHGDLGQVYPIARGTAPLLTAVAATVMLHEVPGLLGWCGLIALTCGILLLAARGGRPLRPLDSRSVGFALLTASTITAYTLVDGIGARVGGPAAYAVWLFLLSGAAMALYGALYVGSRRLIGVPGGDWVLALCGAGLSTAAYAIVIWAMTVAPIAVVAALRETSVLFATLISTLVLREPWLAPRIGATLLVLAGALLLRVS